MNTGKSIYVVHNIRIVKLIIGVFIFGLLVAFLNGKNDTGFRALADDETNYTVSSEAEIRDAIKKINEKESGEYTVTLGSDIIFEHGEQNSNLLNLNKNSVTIYGEDHTLSLLKSYISVTGNSTLNLGAPNYNKTLSIKDKPPETGNACTPLLTANNATLNMYEGVTLSGRNGIDTTGGVQLNSNSTFNMYGGEISNCQSDTAAGGVLASSHSRFNMTGGTIKNCHTGGRGINGGGGVAAINSSEFEMTAGTIENCRCISDTEYGGYGGGVYLSSNSQFKMNGGSIKDCNSSKSGGGICSSNSQFEMNDGLVKNCNSSTSGGGVCLSGTPFKMTGGVIQNCSSVNYGGGVYTNSEFEMAGGTIKNCVNSGYGGAGVCIYTPRGTDTVGFEMSGGEITDCTAYSNNSGQGLGGGVFLIRGLADIKDGSKIYNNQASLAGDDIFSYGSNTKLRVGNVPEGLILSETNHEIDGWYADGVVEGEDTPRWDKDNFAQKYIPSPETIIETQIALKAAHGPIDYNYYNYTVKYYLDGKIDEELTQTGTSDTVHVDGIVAPDKYKIDSTNYVNIVAPTAEAPGSFEVNVYCSKEVKPATELRCKTELDGQVLNVILQDPNCTLPDDIYLKVTLVPKNTSRWNELYSGLDNTDGINKIAFFDVELLYKSNDQPVKPMPLRKDVRVLFEIPNGWNKKDMETVLVMVGGENIKFEKDVISIDGADYLAFWTNHFSPYALIERSSDNAAAPLEEQADKQKNSYKQNAGQKVPQTGESDLQLYIVFGMLFVSSAAMFIAFFDRKRKID